MLKRAMIAGLNAGGVNVMDLEVASVPLTRFHCRAATVSGAVSLRLSPDDPDAVIIRFFDTDGSDIVEEQQRKIERLFGREDFRRVRPADIGDIDLVPRALEQYAVALEQTIDVKAVGERHFKVVIDYSYGTDQLRHAQRPVQAAGRGPGRQPVRLDLRGHGVRPSSPTPTAWPTWCGRPGPTWGPCSTRPASSSPWWTTTGPS